MSKAKTTSEVAGIFLLTTQRSWHPPPGADPAYYEDMPIYQYRLFYKRKTNPIDEWLFCGMFDFLPPDGDQSKNKAWKYIIERIWRWYGVRLVKDQILPFRGDWRDCLEIVKGWEKLLYDFSHYTPGDWIKR